MKFISYSSSGGAFVKTTFAKIDEVDLNELSQLKKKVNFCPFLLYIIGNGSISDTYRYRETEFSSQIQEIKAAWVNLCIDKPINILETELYLSQINKYGDRLSNREKGFESRLYRIKGDLTGKSFFYLYKENELEGLSIYLLRALCNLWQVEEGYIPLHSTAIIHKDSLILFSGPSQSGKSTIAELSRAIGYEMLDHDQVMIYKKSERTFSANGWGYNLQSCSLPIRAFLRIEKDTVDKLHRISERKLTNVSSG
jgi:hypothetical protein